MYARVQELFFNNLKTFENEAIGFNPEPEVNVMLHDVESATGRSVEQRKLLETLNFLSSSCEKLKLDTQFESFYLSQVKIIARLYPHGKSR